jgi:hypothetical protein
MVLRMFFRHEKPHHVSFAEYLDVLRKAGFTVDSQGSKARVTRGKVAAELEDQGGEHPYVDRAGLLIGTEIGYGVNGGYQSFVRTPTGKIAPALARDLKALHAFEEDLKEALGLTSLYNESLGTTFDQHMYDRVVNRDAGVHRPWEQKTALR